LLLMLEARQITVVVTGPLRAVTRAGGARPRHL
jgi:hypothetical protein